MSQTLPRCAALVAIIFGSVSVPSMRSATPPDSEFAVMQVDEAYRIAKLQQDTATLSRILAENFYEMNQNGNGRDKAQSIDLWKSFSIASLTTDTHEVRLAGDRATVTGTQTENGVEHMLFTRVYVNGAAGWQLLASMQFRNPNPVSSYGSAAYPASIGPQNTESAVMRVDEAYRLAKLHQDTAALNIILADAFVETNQNGNSRNKAQSLDLWKSFSIDSLTTDTAKVRIAGETATINGTQTENGFEHMLFTRVYVKGLSGWQLLASMQFRNPNQYMASN